LNTIATHMVIWFLHERIEFFYLPTVLSHLFFKLSLKLQFPEAMSDTSVSEVQVAGRMGCLSSLGYYNASFTQRASKGRINQWACVSDILFTCFSSRTAGQILIKFNINITSWKDATNFYTLIPSCRVKVYPCARHEDVRGSGGTAALILNLGRFTPLPLYPPEIRPLRPLYRRLCWYRAGLDV
jgi:hypothetical protein